MKVTESEVVAFIILSMLYLSTCLASIPPPSSIHKTHTPGIHRKQEELGKDGKQGEKTDIKETVPGFIPVRRADDSVDVLPPLASHFFNWLDKDGRDELELLRRAYYHPRPRPRNDSTPVEQRNVGVERNTNNVDTPPKALYAIVTESSPPAPPPSPPSSSCSSLTCAWFHSWQFTFITCLTGTWLVAVMSLSCMARTSMGRYVLDAVSSCCAEEKDDRDNQVLAKGIGYFDGSPGMRRFVLIEDDDDDEEEEEEAEEDSNGSESQESGKDLEVEGRSVGKPARVWRPPRKGTYLLQEASKDYVLELGTYRLQEDVDQDEGDDKVEYVLEGGTYILHSERVGRGGGGRVGGRRIEDIGSLYGFIEGGGGRIGEIEGLYGIIRQGRRVGVRGEGGRRRGDDGVILSVKELEGDIGGGKTLNVEEASSGGGRETGGLGLEVAGGGAVRGGVEGQRFRSRSALPTKRAASFPMDNYTPSHLLPRKLSLIREEIH